MPGSTPNLSLPYPLLTDAADIETFGVKPLALALDNLDIVHGSATPPTLTHPTTQAWQTLAVSCTNWTGGNLHYYKDPLGIVHFKNESYTATSGSVAAGSTIGTMPANYRPGWTQYALFGTANPASFVATPQAVTISSAGVITLLAGGGSGLPPAFWWSSYRAEN